MKKLNVFLISLLILGQTILGPMSIASASDLDALTALNEEAKAQLESESAPAPEIPTDPVKPVEPKPEEPAKPADPKPAVPEPKPTEPVETPGDDGKVDAEKSPGKEVGKGEGDSGKSEDPADATKPSDEDGEREALAEDGEADDAVEEEERELYQASDLGKIFTFRSFQKGEQNIGDGAEIDFTSSYQVEYDWNTENIDVKAGDIATLQLPDVFKHWENTPGLDIKADGISVGKYSINNGVLTFVFNEKIEGGNAVQNGYVGFKLEFNKEKFLEEWKHEIDFDSDGVKDLTVIVKPGGVETSLDKEGHPDSELDAKEITWEVDFTNGSNEAIKNGFLTDILPEGLGEARDFVVKELSFDFDGKKTVGNEVAFNEPTVDSNGFKMSFDNVPARGGYRVEYTTTIEDYTKDTFTNNASFEYGETNLPADATVNKLTRSNPIEKDGWQVGNTDVIEWKIAVNKNGQQINNAIVKDELPAGLTIADGSIEVYKIVNGHPVLDETVDTTEFPIKLGLGKLESTDEYEIKFKTNVNWSEVNDSKYKENNGFTNKAILYDGENEFNNDDATVNIKRDPILEKVEVGNVDYENRTITWKVTVNKAKHPLNDVTVTDILPAGLLLAPEDIEITGDDEGTDFSGVTPSIDTTNDGENDGKTKLTINLTDVGRETITIKYTTSIDDFKAGSFTNTVGMTGDGVGEGGKDREVTIQPNANTYTKNFAGIDYNAKTIDWRLNVNPVREDINSGFVIRDTFTNDGLILLPKTVKITLGKDKLEEVTDYTVAPIDDGYQNGFTITFNRVVADGELIVKFTTSYDPQLEVDGKFLISHSNDEEDELYRNKAEFNGTTENGNEIKTEANASQKVRDDSWNSGKKEGQLVHFDEEGNKVNGWVSGAERKIAWQLYTNYQKQNLGTGVVITDTLAYAGTIDKESIKVSIYDVDVSGNASITSEELEASKYVTKVEGDKFTLTFNTDFTVDERYVIEFTTSVPDISKNIYTNNAMLKVGGSEYPYTATVSYNKSENYLDKQALDHSGNDVFIGEELEWEVTVNESLSVVKRATIKDTISAGLTYVVGSLEITTQSGARLVEDTDYTLEVSGTDKGETILEISFENDVTEALTLNYITVVTAENNEQVSNKVELEGVSVQTGSKETNKLTAKQFSWVGGEFNPERGAIKVLKVDSASEEVIDADEATFELYYELNGERVQFGEEFTTVNGILEIGNLPLRTYYLTEVDAPNGYGLSEKEIEIVVDKTFNSNNGNIINVSFENQKLDRSVKLIKTQLNNPTRFLEGAEFKLVKDDGTGNFEVVVGFENLVTDVNGEIPTLELDVGKYQFIETKAPSGYRLDATPVEFEIKENQTKTVEVEKENRRNPGGGGTTPPQTCDAFTVTVKQDDVNVEADVELVLKSGTTEITGKTNADGKIIFEKGDLPEGEYEAYDKDGNDLGTVTVSYDKDECQAVVNITTNTCDVFTVTVKENGNPVGEDVELTVKDKDGKEVTKGKTDKDGKIVFEETDLPEGEYTVYDEEDNEVGTITVSYDGNCEDEVNLTPNVCDEFTVTVKENGKPVGEDVELTVKDKDGKEVTTGKTDKDGKIVFEETDLPEGEYTVYDEEDNEVGKITVTYEGNCEDEVNLTPNVCDVFTVTVKENGQPVDAHTALILKDETGKNVAAGSADADGKITFDKVNLPAGTYTAFDVDDKEVGKVVVSYNKDECQAVIDVGEEVKVCETFTLTLTDKPNADVSLKDSNGKTIAEGKTDKDGKVIFTKPIPEGTYTVVVDGEEIGEIAVTEACEGTITGSPGNPDPGPGEPSKPGGGGGGSCGIACNPPTDPTDPDKPVGPPTGPTEPGKPVDPPTGPAEPGKPVGPPTGPTDPNKPGESGKPGEPNKPAEPGKPGDSTNKLPQTGEEQFMYMIALGVLFLVAGSALLYRQRRKA